MSLLFQFSWQNYLGRATERCSWKTAAPEKETTFYQKFKLLHAFLRIAIFKKHNLFIVAVSSYYFFENLLQLIDAIMKHYNYLIM